MTAGGVEIIVGLGVLKAFEGVPGTTSLVSESPSWVSPGGNAGVATGEVCDVGSCVGCSARFNPRATGSISTAW